METPPPSFSLRLWRLVFYGGTSPEHSQADRDKIYVINVYSVLGFVSLLLFGVLHMFAEGNVELGKLEVAASVIILLNAIGLRLTRSIPLTRTFFIFAILVVLFALLTTGGTAETGAFWVFVFPSLVFFSAGKRKGLRWLGALYVLIITLTVLSKFELITIPYSLVQMRQLMVSLAVVAVGIYIYQDTREQALKQIQASQRDLQEYLDHMTTFSVKVGLDGRISFANKIAKEISGLGDHLIGTKFLEGSWWTFDDAVARRMEAAFYQVLTGKAVNYDERMRIATTTGRQILTVNFSMIPIFEGERISYVLAEARDISAEEEIDRAKSEFVALASHQLRAPVSAIAFSVNTLLTNGRGRLSPEQYRNIQQIYQQNRLMSALINDLLVVSSLELGNLPVNPQDSALADISAFIAREIRTSHLTGRTLQIGEDYAKDLPRIDVDPELVRIILRNLLANAVTYTPDAGHVNIRVSQTEEKVQPDSKGSIQIEIQDSGVGIPEDAQKKIFTKFFRVKSQQNKSQGGTGLGLYIVKKLLDYTGGKVSFTSKENVGTIFIVLLPLEGMRPHITEAVAGES